MEIIDLSHVIEEGMSVYPGDPPPGIRSIATLNQEGFSEKELLMSTHTGTHIDAPAHLLTGGLTLDLFPPEKFVGEARVINCYRKSLITLPHIKKQIPEKIPDFFLIYTGWDSHWGTGSYYRDIPVMDEAVAEFLGNLSLKGIGMDAPSFDPVGSEKLINHRHFLSRDILLIENLTQLQNLVNRRFIFSCFPLKFKHADGSPVRAMAMIQDQS
jgi:kynurenine formamidase